MPKGLLDDIPIHNIARDKAWEAFIKRKDVKKLGIFDKGFPLYGGYYELWCQAWARAWDDGFKEALTPPEEKYQYGTPLLDAFTKEKNT